jgi:hypothetical protein
MQTMRPSGMKQKFAHPEKPLGEKTEGNSLRRTTKYQPKTSAAVRDLPTFCPAAYHTDSRYAPRRSWWNKIKRVRCAPLIHSPRDLPSRIDVASRVQLDAVRRTRVSHSKDRPVHQTRPSRNVVWEYDVVGISVRKTRSDRGAHRERVRLTCDPDPRRQSCRSHVSCRCLLRSTLSLLG